MQRLSTLWLVIAVAAFAGCRGKSDLVEAELRVKDRQLREVRSELDRSAMLNEAYENSLREQRFVVPRGPGQMHAVVKEVQIGRGSGGIDEDRHPGDEGILLVIVPLDTDGSAVKVSGTLHITALQITPEGLKVPLSSWDVSGAYLMRNWRSGLLSTGYYVSLPWQVVPCYEKLRVIATFTTTDGAVFEAERDLGIHLGPIDPNKPPTAGPNILPPPTPTTDPKTAPNPTTPPGALPPPVPAAGSPNAPTSWKPIFDGISGAQLQPPQANR
ncbi:MAG: hypothetical protein ACJ8C4_18820 [Gemmataceae bacterium]